MYSRSYKYCILVYIIIIIIIIIIAAANDVVRYCDSRRRSVDCY